MYSKWLVVPWFDRFRPVKKNRIGLFWTPSKWPNSMAEINVGDPDYLLTGMMLQVASRKENNYCLIESGFCVVNVGP